MWLGEKITDGGVGNGISLLIMIGIIAVLPSSLSSEFAMALNAQSGGLVMFLVEMVILVVVIGLCILLVQGTRRIPVQYGRSVFRSGRMYRQSGSSYLPLRINSAGMIPLIFAFSIVILPGTIANYLATNSGIVGRIARIFADLFNPGAPLYWVLVFILVVLFTFFYTMVVFQQQQLAENLQKNGGFVLGIRPGQPTQDYLNKVILRLTLGGALFLGFVAIVPYIASLITGVQALTLSSTSLLILVGVALDTLRQLESQLMMRDYDGFMR